ncbi:MAG: site-specific tyrosine recombinase [Eubacteriaceae bacterium]|nr:site-specific tyrosine recombinase [Eubacteriaceae bacterium]
MYSEDFLLYLNKERKMSQNTQEAYKRDVLDFFDFIKSKGIGDPADTSNTEVIAYLFKQKDEGKSASTINRKLASVRAFFKYMGRAGRIKDDPTLDIKPPKVEKKELEYLSIAEVEKLLETPDGSDRGKRDRALMELLYATGIRVNEVIAADLADVNLRIGFFTCTGESGKARIIPVGRPAKAAMETYIYDARKKLTANNEDEKALFVNYYGSRMTRQGLWKILKEYGKKAGIEKKMTPHLLRISFAVHMVQNGADLKSLQELLGHEDLTATQVYLSVAKNRIKDVYDNTHPRA